MEVKTPIDVGGLRAARWFAGKSREVGAVAQIDAVAVPGDRGRIAIVEVIFRDGGSERYLTGDGSGGELGPGVVAALVAGLSAGPLPTARGRLELRPGPALARLAPTAHARETVPSTDQTNTLVALDERLLVKVYRRLEAGVHPEVEVLASLAGTEAPVPDHAGSVHHVAPDGRESAIMLLQEFVPAAESGWEAPIERAAQVLRDGRDPSEAAAEYAAAGRTAAALHRALAAVHGLTAVDHAGARMRASAEAALSEVAAADPPVRAVAGAVRARLASLADGCALTVGQVHGDLHYAQFLRAPGRLLVVDFEGDPTAPLHERREPRPPLHDIACLLRSIDHIGSAAARRAGADATAFAAVAGGAALTAYEAEAGARVDRHLLAALEIAKEVQELLYAQRVEPAWSYAPRAGLARLLGGGAA